MSNIWVTSDCHFGHKNILRFNTHTRTEPSDQVNQMLELQGRLNQGFDPDVKRQRDVIMEDLVEEMNQTMIDNWKRQVQAGDTVYILGDVFFCQAKPAMEILDQLPGEKHLVLGNHDQLIRKNHAIQRRFASIQELLDIRIGGQHTVMFHYPIMSWNRCHYGAYHLFGHVHGNLDQDQYVNQRRMMDVGIDSRPGGVAPRGGLMHLWHWDEIRDILEPRKGYSHHD